MSGIQAEAGRIVESAETLAKKIEDAVENELIGNKTPKDGSAAIQSAQTSPSKLPPTSASILNLFVAVKGALNIVGTAAVNFDQIVATAVASTPSNDIEAVIAKARNLMSFAKNDLTAFDEAVVFARTLVKI